MYFTGNSQSYPIPDDGEYDSNEVTLSEADRQSYEKIFSLVLSTL